MDDKYRQERSAKMKEYVKDVVCLFVGIVGCICFVSFLTVALGRFM